MIFFFYCLFEASLILYHKSYDCDNTSHGVWLKAYFPLWHCLRPITSKQYLNNTIEGIFSVLNAAAQIGNS